MAENKKKFNILVVDDDSGYRNLLDNKLSTEGFSVTLAATGMHARNIIKSGKPIDLILCDVKMPGESGLDLARYIKKESHATETPVIMLTASNSEQEITKAVKAGVSGYLLKPVGHGDLMKKVYATLGLQYLDHFEIEGLANPTETYVNQSIRVVAIDSSGELMKSYARKIRFSSNDRSAELPERYQFTAEDEGSKIFEKALRFNTAGTFYLEVTDGRGKCRIEGIEVKAAGKVSA